MFVDRIQLFVAICCDTYHCLFNSYAYVHLCLSQGLELHEVRDYAPFISLKAPIMCSMGISTQKLLAG